MAFIDYGPDVTPEQYEAALKESFVELTGRPPAPSPADMPKKKRGKK